MSGKIGQIQQEAEIIPDRSIGFLHLDNTTGHIETRKSSPQRLLAIQPLEPQEEDSLIDDWSRRKRIR